MSLDIVLVFAIGVATIAAFISERWSVDQVALTVPAALLLAGVIDFKTAVAGVSNPATITVASLLIIGLGLYKCGVVDALGRFTSRLAIGTFQLRLLVLLLIVVALSPFVSNTAVVVVFMPVFMEMARRAKVAASRVLIPLSYAAVLGGTITLIGTSTNLIVHNTARNRGYDDLSMFDIAPLGLIYAGVGMVYLMLIGRYLLRDRATSGVLDNAISARLYTTELHLTENSPAVGRHLDELDWLERYKLQDVRPLHHHFRLMRRRADRLRPDDVLSVTGDAAAIFAFARAERLATPLHVQRPEPPDDREPQIIELMVAPGGTLVGRSIRDVQFASRYSVVVLAVQRAPLPISGLMSHERLAGGDLLLVQGHPDALGALASDPGFVAIGRTERHDQARRPSWLATAILAAVVITATTDLMSIAEAALLGAVVMTLTGCIHLREIYQELDWQIMVLLAGLLPLGMALDMSGAAELIGDQLATLLGDTHPAIAIGGFYLVTSLLTEIMSNVATAIVLTPVAITTALGMDMNPYALIVTVMFGASASFMTPMGYQTNALVYGPGGYRFTDYLRVGAPLNLILAFVAALAIPWLWPS